MTRHGGGLQPPGDAFRIACRMFPGFEELPAAFRATLDPYAPLFDPATGPLDLRERELIARAVTGREAGSFGDSAGATAAPVAHDGDVADADDHVARAAAAPDDARAERDRLIAGFAVKVTRRWLAIGGGDVERLLDAGVQPRAIRAIAETAAVFHFLGELSAAMLLRPRVPALGGRARVAAVASRDPSWRELSRWLA